MGGIGNGTGSKGAQASANMLEDAVALVTGGGRGLGFEIAKTLAHSGATVCMTGRDHDTLRLAAEEIESAGGNAEYMSGDVSDRRAMETAVAHFRDVAGSITVLVNNAGIGLGGPLSETDPDEWWRVMEVNVKGPMLMSRLVLPDMLDLGYGHIINLASYQAVGPAPMVSAYGTSKAALLRFTDSLSAEVIDRGVIVTAVSPGWVWTDMTREAEQLMRTMDPSWEGIDQEYIFEASAVCKLIEEIATGKTAPLHGRLLHVKDSLDELLEHADEIVDQDRLALRFTF